MRKPKTIKIQLRTAEKLMRTLGKYEEQQCTGCEGMGHQDSCPAHEAWQLRNYLTVRINNPNREFGV